MLAPPIAQAALLQPRTGDCSPGATEVADDTQIQAAFAAATDDSVICVTANITVSSTLSLDDTSLRLEAVAPLTSLSGNGVRRILDVDYTSVGDDTLTIVGLDWTRGSATGVGPTGSGGTIRVQGEGSATADRLVIEGGAFTLSTAAADGGAVYASNVSRVTVRGGAIFGSTVASGNGGALAVSGNLGSVVIQQSAWNQNLASLAGGAIYATLPLSIQSATFDWNQASGVGHGGGAVASTSILSVTGSTFTSNVADTGGATLSLGGVTTVTASAFTSNTGRSRAGAVGGNGNINVSSSTFTSNIAGVAGVSGSGGGAVHTYGSVTSQSSTYSGNVAHHTSGHGGAIYAQAALTTTDDTYSSNTAGGDGGALFSTTSDVDTESGVYVNNSAARFGGGIRAGNDVISTDDSFALNDAVSDGGAVYANRRVNISQGVFNGNDSQGSGGAVVAIGPGNIQCDVTGSTFAGNSSVTSGGAVWSPGCYLMIGDSTFVGNRTAGDGGAIYSSSATGLSLLASGSGHGVTLKDNYADGSGGAVWAYGVFNARESAFIGNGDDSLGVVRTQKGGAIHVETSASLLNVTSYANVADDTGGLISAGASTTFVDLSYVTSVDDSAPVGGAIAFPTNDDSITLRGSVLQGSGARCAAPGPGPANVSVNSAGSYVTDNSCGIADDSIILATPSSLGFTTPITTDDTPGSQVLVPDAASVLINRVPSNLVFLVSVDQLGNARNVPSGLTTVGALRVLPQPTFTASPQSQSVTPGASATFTAAASGGTDALTLQWQRSTDGGTSWSSIAGATGSSYTTGPVAAGDSGTRYRATATDVNLQVGTSAPATLTVTPPNPPGPGPSPTTPPSAPLSPRAEAGSAQARVTWLPPAQSGSSPVTTYEVASDVGGHTCVPKGTDPSTLACEVTALSNGSTYRFQVRARNSAGWGPWSEWTTPVTPAAPVSPSVLITGSRMGMAAIVQGTSTGLVGTSLTPRVRLAGQTAYRTGVVRPTVGSDGSFTWQRRTGKGVRVYFVAEDLRSNRVIIRPFVGSTR